MIQNNVNKLEVIYTARFEFAISALTETWLFPTIHTYDFILQYACNTPEFNKRVYDTQESVMVSNQTSHPLK